jgi:hypothetical protein
VAIDDTDNVLYSPSNESAGMIHCNPLEDTVAESPVVRTRLVAKFDSAQENAGSKDSTVTENSLPPPKKCLQNVSVLQQLSSVDEEAPCKTTRAKDHVKTPSKTSGGTMTTQSPRARNLAQLFQQRKTRFQDGYNSDGKLGPFSSVVDLEGVQDFEEDALPEFQDALDGTHVPASTIATAVKEDTFLADAAANHGATNKIDIKLTSETVATAELDVDKMKVTVLRDKLRKRGVSVHGVKLVLVERLKLALADGVPVISHQANRKRVNAANKAKTKSLPWA